VLAWPSHAALSRNFVSLWETRYDSSRSVAVPKQVRCLVAKFFCVNGFCFYAGHGSGFRVNETGGNAKLGARYDVGTLGAACGGR